jgi:RHS repeat-associated protein
MRFGDVISEKKNGDLQKTIIFADDFGTITENGVTKNLYYISRGDGLTGHEHLPEFKLINMNGRVYDPVVGRFLSPDPFVQAPDFSQSFNRYSYCLNNPLKYTDPTGENPLLAAIVIGALINTTMQSMAGNVNSTGDFWKAMGIGALSGLAGYGAGSLVSGALGTATTLGGSILNGATVGAAAGFTGGFVGGSGNAWGFQNASFKNGLKAGLIGGGWGALGGAVIGGVTGGLQYNKQMALFHKGNDVLGVNAGDAVPQTDAFLNDAQSAWYPDAPREYVDAFSTENLSADAIAHFKANPTADGITIPKAANGLLTGRSDVFFNSNAFSSAKQLFFTMGHEFIHVSQFAYLGSIGTSVNLINTTSFRDMMEFHAYNYQSTLMADEVRGTNMNSFTNSYVRQLATQYQSYFPMLGHNNFGWTKNVLYCYPF